MKTITQAQYDEAIRQSLPAEDDINPPNIESQQPYFTSWMTEHLLEQLPRRQGVRGRAEGQDHDRPRAPGRGRAARSSAGSPAWARTPRSWRSRTSTGEVRAMVGGSDFNARPFNLATNGHRQPGSAFKPFILVRALDDGIDPNSAWASQPKTFPFENGHGQKVTFDGQQLRRLVLGTASLWSATAHSDNSVFAELGMKVEAAAGRARWRSSMGIRTKLSTNPAMMLGGLKEGVTPLEMAYAYSTIANDGVADLRLAGARTRPARSAIQSVEERRRQGRREQATSRARVPGQGRPGGEGHARPGRQRAAPARPRRWATSSSGARPARPRTTATPGSWAATTT